MYDLTTLRQNEFPVSHNYIYFNHAGISPLPIRTRDKVQWAVAELAAQPGDLWLNHGLPAMETFRRDLATLINAADPQEVVPATTTSFALNSFAQSVAWQPGDNVLFCEVEFPSNAYPWMSLERDGVEVRQVPAVGGGLTLPALEPLVDERTRLIAASAIQFFSGHRTDLATIGAFCRERGILFVVDAIQAIGHMAFDVQAMNIDVLASGGQKSLMALPGIGFMYIRAPICQTLKPRFVGGNATVDYMHWLDYDMTFLPGAQRFAIGTPNLPGIFSVCASLSLLRELGVDNIDRHTSRLAAQAIDVLSGMGYEVITSRQAHGPIVTFKSGLSHQATDALVEQLQQRRVTLVKHLDAAGTPHVRLSFHCYNTAEEIEQFMQILDEARLEIGD